MCHNFNSSLLSNIAPNPPFFLALIVRVCLDTTYFIKNWKYCSKINFKYMNSTVRLIFNENFCEKRGLCVLLTVYGPTEKHLKPQKCF